ncbi:hypothetical protein LTR56_002970 [Elasticomyces elasticus]|nr:hypothetical protein LTR22_014693 [Elasticomyces elasticus]KAK3656622.1 hypothetical protein LTR56_002970 [Elasticomyces elasticus]KAK4930754.1 hypothetical protein LTR49_002842 [Elasticomyces elasticus]KAK5755617.1 hypothetical protein LTS12_014276 [Elasticomyces elasticus]
MVSSTFSHLLAASGGIATAYRTPSPAQLGEISILASNNLRTSDAGKTSAALLLKNGQSQWSAQHACAALGEQLYSPSAQDFAAGLNQSLAYEVYAGRLSNNQLMWVASDAPTSHHHWQQHCTAMDTSGVCHPINCKTDLPVLCSQSAPASNAYNDTAESVSDTSSQYQVALPVGNQVLVGYRDFYTFQFKGVRFAEEPERFTYSSTYTNATGTNSALAHEPECLQAPNNGSTDCLFLNLWTPSLPSSQQPSKQNLKPVMVYIYGGGFATGSASNPTNDGGNHASRGDVVMVDLAYRLNSLGFLALNDGVHNGNYWISDLISGLEWIQKYISAFGGDPEQVMIYGESAGAQSVQALLASPKAIGLFRAAIMQSNYYQRYVPLADAFNSTTVPILNATGCASSSDQLACLQAVNATDLINLKPNFNYPVVDGTYLTSTYIDLNASAAGNTTSSVPVLYSVNRDEAGVLNSPPSSSNFTEAIYELAASQPQDTPNASAILANPAVFPVGTGPSLNNTALNQVFNTTIRIYTDTDFHCSDEFTALGAVNSGVWPKVYYAEFNRTYQEPGYNMNNVCQAPVTSTHPFGDPELEYFKCHAGDLPMSFGTFVFTAYPERDENDLAFSQLVVDYWTSFARTLDPNPNVDFLKARGYWSTINQVGVSGTWEQVDVKEPKMLELQWNSAMKPFPDSEQCAILGQPLDYLL